MRYTPSQEREHRVSIAIAAFSVDGLYTTPNHAQSWSNLENTLGSRTLAVNYVELGGRVASYLRGTHADQNR